MELKMNECGLYCYNPNNNTVVPINTIYRNNQIFLKKQINGAEQAKTMHTKLRYPSVKYFKWIVQNQQIIDCPVTVQDIDIVHKFGAITLRLKREYH